MSEWSPRNSRPPELPSAGPVADVLRQLAATAPSCVSSVQLVGGPVRDLLLGRSLAGLVDLDVVVEGDAIGFSRALTRTHGGSMVAHGRFGTATWSPPGGAVQVDLVTARAESYPAPGALPETSPSDLADDLLRRDFTVHSVALQLWPQRQLLDPCGGRADLGARLLRVHHPRSFEDDPTRLLRAARYAVRFGLTLEDHTADRFAGALAAGSLRTVSADRLRQEWRRTLAEPEPAAVLAWMVAAGLAAALGLAEAPAFARALPALREGGVDALELGSLALLAAPETLLQLPDGPAARLARLRALDPTALRAAADDELEHALPRDPLAPILLAARFPELAPRIERARQLRDTPPLLRGSDLLEAGLAAGPAVGRALEELRAAQHRGEVSSPDDALTWLRQRGLLP